MDSVRIRRIRCADPGADRQLAALRQQLTSLADVISPRGRTLTERVFGEPLPPALVVERICRDVRARGLKAVLDYTEQLDGVRVTEDMLRVSTSELAQAHAAADPAFLESVRRVRQNVLAFQVGILNRDAALSMAGSHELRLRYRPVGRVGICIPGGAAAYPSTLLMTVCPAQAAGVPEVAVVLPPTPTGGFNREILATCRELGVAEVYRVGGAQAVAALAYGVEGIPRVDMIVGPGNIFVTLAKRFVFGQVAIDCLAGPSEVVVVADDTAPPAFVAADLIAQAEHDPGSSILITWHPPLVEAVAEQLDQQLQALPRAAQARASLENFGAVVLARSAAEAMTLVNRIAPEHLHLATSDPEALLPSVDNAGAIFLGHYAPVAVGDYAAGPSHVLPTGGTARFASGLCANDFLRRSSVLAFTREGLARMAGDVQNLAAKEGLTGHAASVLLRLGDGDEVLTRNKRSGPARQVSEALDG
jgi:histidinol dehydrogenase